MLKVGKIEYLNTIPVYYGFSTGEVPTENVKFVESVPSELNQMLRNGELDISVISSYEYILNSEKYLLLPNLSISAKKKVFSVLFLSNVPIHQLHRKDVWLTKSSMTSKELLKYILKEVYGVEPNYRYYSLKEGNLPKNPTALLVIGDDALKFSQVKKFPFVYDLAEEWFNLFGLPFVFALWAVRKDSFEKKKEEVINFYNRLKLFKSIGLKSLKEIAEIYSDRLNLPTTLCYKYLSHLEFNLPCENLKSLKKFSEVVNKPFSVKFALYE